MVRRRLRLLSNAGWLCAGVIAVIGLAGCAGAGLGVASAERSQTRPEWLGADRSGEAAMRGLEAHLLRERPLRLGFQITAEGEIGASLRGTLTLGEGGVVEMLAAGRFREEPVRLSLRSDGDRLVGGSGEREFSIESPPALHEALVIGLTRMGLLHNLAVLTGGAPPDRATGGVREWVQVEEVSRECEDALGADGAEALCFAVVVSGSRVGRATLLLDSRTGLPLRREQTVQFPGGEMRVIEEYTPLDAP